MTAAKEKMRLGSRQNQIYAFAKSVHPEPVYGIDAWTKRILESLVSKGLLAHVNPPEKWIATLYRLSRIEDQANG